MAVVNLMADASSERSPEMIQALIIYAIAVHARYEPGEAMTAITKAADIAIGLGMNRAEYAEAHGFNDPVVEESMRRTWWELYVADGYLASLHRHTTFRSNSVPSTAYLPCEESLYSNGLVVSEHATLDQFDSRHFADEERQFSSFCYRIDAIRIMARVMAVSTENETHADAIQAIDNAIAAWRFNLPNDKAGIVDHTGEVDQMMFQALLYIQSASIFLHFPRSELPISMPAAAEIQCAQRHMAQVSPTSTQHAAKALAASKDLANLASLPMDKYSPFFICGLVFACVVQLSACSAYPRGSTEQNRDRVALLIGLLKSLSRHWSIAKYVSQQLRRAANEIFNPRPEAVTSTHSSNSTYDSGIDVNFPSDISWFDMFYNDGAQGMQVQAMELNGL
ncbi:hypothetical protein HII31_06865 [Pseudocercospora fuligena]|uniref:Xylanolytic transcriptional activator regulatory domain-containing protein n=1 Tax=Pseudocercospora fuligena TaxID=685502 RepID=A0A8H6RHB5_9PEZI|nr:hypothetical protein HII31_06865 [Pseudocercospora fuligena]